MFTAYDIHIHELRDTAHPFGIGPPRLAAELRKFADAVEAGQVYLQVVSVESKARTDDFPMTYIKLEFYEPRPKT